MSSIPSGARARARSSGERMTASAVARSGERKASSLTGGFSGRERGERVWGNREVPPLGQGRGAVGETWFPPRERAGGERRSRPQLLPVGVEEGSQAHPRLLDAAVHLDRDLGVVRGQLRRDPCHADGAAD